MNVIQISLLGVVALVVFSQGWVNGFKTWVQAKVSQP